MWCVLFVAEGVILGPGTAAKTRPLSEEGIAVVKEQVAAAHKHM